MRTNGMESEKNLIADIGMHDGEGTRFFLKKGYNVVAVEANPQLVEINRSRFADEIEQGRLILIHGAIGSRNGVVQFYINDRKSDWSSVHKRIANRDNQGVRSLEVPGIQASDFFNSYNEDLFYVKIDVEGGDIDVLLGLTNSNARPKYLSIEATAAWHLGVMRMMGYDRFKLLNQSYFFDWSIPSPPIHGRPVDHQFRSGSSGPFGEETTGEWCDVETVISDFILLKRLHAAIPDQMKHSWWDFHAAMGSSPDAD